MSRDRRLRPIAAAAIAVLLVLAAAALIVRSYDGLFSPCTPPSQAQMEAQEVFVRSQLSKVSDPRWTIDDCDNQGAASLDFSTTLSPTDARTHFLSNPSCSPYSETEDDIAVQCTSDDENVYIFFTPAPRSQTRGELVLP